MKAVGDTKATPAPKRWSDRADAEAAVSKRVPSSLTIRGLLLTHWPGEWRDVWPEEWPRYKGQPDKGGLVLTLTDSSGAKYTTPRHSILSLGLADGFRAVIVRVLADAAIERAIAEQRAQRKGSRGGARDNMSVDDILNAIDQAPDAEWKMAPPVLHGVDKDGVDPGRTPPPPTDRQRLIGALLNLLAPFDPAPAHYSRAEDRASPTCEFLLDLEIYIHDMTHGSKTKKGGNKHVASDAIREILNRRPDQRLLPLGQRRNSLR